MNISSIFAMKTFAMLTLYFMSIALQIIKFRFVHSKRLHKDNYNFLRYSKDGILENKQFIPILSQASQKALCWYWHNEQRLKNIKRMSISSSAIIFLLYYFLSIHYSRNIIKFNLSVLFNFVHS